MCENLWQFDFDKHTAQHNPSFGEKLTVTVDSWYRESPYFCSIFIKLSYICTLSYKTIYFIIILLLATSFGLRGHHQANIYKKKRKIQGDSKRWTQFCKSIFQFNELTNEKNLVLHSSHFALNWRCCNGCALGERSSGDILKFRTSSFKCYVDHSHTVCSSGNIDVRNWVHLFESPCICIYVDKRMWSKWISLN